MKQILQNVQTGITELVDVPSPHAETGQVLIQTRCSLISAGTERMLVDFSKSGWLDKARQQPEKVRMVLDKARTDGLLTTMEAVRSKLAHPLPLGYCNAGTVVEVGAGVTDLRVGDRVASNGNHADLVRVPRNLCAPIPEDVDHESGAFTVLASIGLQGVRLAQPTLGECFVVTGTGLIGLVTVQLLQAQGCRVLAIDIDADKLALAARFGAVVCNLGEGEDPVAAGLAFSEGRGVDGVIITASTSSSDPVSQAARMSRQRGRIVLVGMTGLELNRSEFYEKELSFQVSCSYGPGRYDPEYEDKGHDYPLGFVRWTEQRNFEAVLHLMAEGKLDMRPLISHRFSFEEAGKAYEMLTSDQSDLGIVLEYPQRGLTTLLESGVPLSAPRASSRAALITSSTAYPNNDVMAGHGHSAGDRGYSTHRTEAEGQQASLGTDPIVSFIGAGNYASRVLIPAFKVGGARLQALVSAGGINSVVHGRKAGFSVASTDVAEMLADGITNAVVVATRHNSHARLVLQALQAGKHVFVEKPLCLTLAELDEIEQAYRNGLPRYSRDEGKTLSAQEGEAGVETQESRPLLMVGFNRRFSPQVQKIKQLLNSVTEPKTFIMTVNAGAIPAGHWTQDPEIGGGRLIGEACHFIDLLRYLADVPIVEWQRTTMDSTAQDTVTLQLSFADGSIGTVHYFANGNKALPKERLEVFSAGRVLQLDNFRRLTSYGWPGFKKMNLWRQDKGQKACAAVFLNAIAQNGPNPIPVDEIFEVSRVTMELAQ